MSSWIEIPEDSDFSLQNIPFGVFSPIPGAPARCGVAIGDYVLDLSAIACLLSDIPGFDSYSTFSQPTLNDFMSCPRSVWTATRNRLIDLLRNGGSDSLKSNAELRKIALHDRRSVQMHLPAAIGDYTDFYSSREHATRVGSMLRDPANALNPNWLHLPVAYHGRASSVVVSGQPVRRPRGQLQKDRQDPQQGSIFAPTRSLDYELEVGFFVGGPPTPLGTPITMEEAEDRIFGMVLLNDWSARDIQAWEYVPLGPFGSKNFATTVSPWVVTLDALAPFRCPTSAGTQEPVPLEYLRDPDYGSYDVRLEVWIQGRDMAAAERVAGSNLASLYWTFKQQLVHHSITGCSMRPGDLLGTGTISGADPGSEGCLLESSRRGTVDVPLGGSGRVRRFLEDGDAVTLRGFCPAAAGAPRVGFGEAAGTILPALGVDSPPAAAPAAAAAGCAAAAAAVAEGESGGKAGGGAGIAERYHSARLYGYWRSSCSWRVRLALAAKGIPYEHCAVDILGGAQLSAEHDARNPMQQVPVLELVDGLTGERISLRQSLAIIEFLEEAFPHRGPRLLPTGPLERARAREMMEIVNSGTQPLQNASVLHALTAAGVDGQAWAAAAIAKGLRALEAAVVACGGGGAAGGGFSLGPLGTGGPTAVDMCLVPQLANARRFGIDPAAVCPTLVRIEAACRALPWFAAAEPDRQPDAAPGP